MRWHMAEDDDIIIVSVSDSSDVEIITSSSEEDCFVPRNSGDQAGNPQPSSGSRDHFKKKESSQSSYPRNQHEKHSKHSKSDHLRRDEQRECYKNMTCETSQAPWHEKKKSHKSWSQIKNEHEKQKHLPPASKRAKLHLPEPMCSNKLCRAIDMSDDDDLPDLDTCRMNPELQTAAPSSPITLSSDDEAANPRPGIFASFNPTCRKTNDDGTKHSLSQCKNNSFTVNRTKLLLTKSAKEKMALIFNTVLRQKSVMDVQPQSPSGFSDMSSSSSISSRQSTISSRHFLDAITPTADGRSCSSPVPSVPGGSIASLLNADITDSDDDDDEEEEHSNPETVESDVVDGPPFTPVKGSKMSFLSAFNQSPEVSRPKKPRLSNGKEAVKSLPQFNIRKYFPVVNNGHPWERLSQEGRGSRRVSYDTKFVQVEEDLASATAALTHLHVNTVDAVFEEGANFLEYGLSLVSDFSSYLKPTESIVKAIINKCLLGISSMYVSYKSFKLLSYLWQKYPSSIHIDWEVFARVLNDLAIEKDRQGVPSASVIKGSLFVQIIVQVLQTDLYGRNLHSPADARRSLCYKLLSVDYAYANLKQIVYWLGNVIISEYTEVDNRGNARLANHVRPPMMLLRGQGDESKWFRLGSGSVPKVLPNLQKLLHLGIQVSRSCVGAAKRIAAELVQTYVYLPDLYRKKLLLQSMSSDLLRFKVTQKILEDHCDGTSLCCEDFPASLRQVVDAYYLASPPRSLVTPPQSPSDDENLDPGVLSQPFSAASCEELAFLVYTNTQSYIRCAHDTEHEPLCQNGFQSHDYFLSIKDQQRLRQSVDGFHDHLCQLTAELNSTTRTYVFMMQCLGNLL